MSPWTFEPSMFVVPAFLGGKIGVGSGGGFVFVEGFQLTKDEGGSVVVGGA